MSEKFWILDFVLYLYGYYILFSCFSFFFSLTEIRKRARQEREEKTATMIQNIKKKQKETEVWEKRRSIIKLSLGLVLIIGFGYFVYKNYSKSQTIKILHLIFRSFYYKEYKLFLPYCEVCFLLLFRQSKHLIIIFLKNFIKKYIFLCTECSKISCFL